MHTVRSALANVRRDLRAAGGSMLAADLMFKLVAAMVLVPAAGLVLRAFVAASGQSVLADHDILGFLVRPIGIACLLVVASLGVAITALQLACAIHIVAGSRTGHSTGAARAVRVALRDTIPIVRLSLRVMGRVLLLTLPFLVAIGAVYVALLREHDINYYLAERPAAFWLAAALVAAIVVGWATQVLPRLAGWIIALPLLLLDRTPVSKALHVSDERTRGRRGQLLLTLLGWGAVMALLPTIYFALLVFAARMSITHLPSELPVVVPVIGGFVLVALVGNLFFSFLQIATLSVLMHGFYAPEASPHARASTARTSPVDPRRISTARWLAIVALGALAATTAGVVLLRSVRLEDRVVIIAHRGGPGAPENTLAAVERGLAEGADMTEIDVQETADGEVVVVHDSDFMRTAGLPLRVWDATFAQLREIDLGSRFSPEFRDQRVPLLAEVLALCRGRSRVNIELKVYGHGERLAERTAEIVDAAGMGDSVVAMSLDHPTAARMKEVRPDWPVGILAATAVGDLSRVESDFLAVSASMVDRRFIERAHGRGKPVYVWTVNDPVQMSRLISLGVDGIITDEPGVARRVLTQRSRMSSVERLLLQAAYYLGVEPPGMDQ